MKNKSKGLGNEGMGWLFLKVLESSSLETIKVGGNHFILELRPLIPEE